LFGPCAVAFAERLCHKDALPPPGSSGLPWQRRSAHQHAHFEQITGRPGASPWSKAAKKRFKVTGTGKVLYAQRGKRHGMIKRTKKQIRQLRGTNVLFKTDGDNIKKYFLPNG
jgi:large subunit ribosomal protein L35